jgi:hypothetical protein
MNIQQLRQSLKMKWLSYYEQNRPWLVKIRIWGTYDGLRRPSSGFMLATLSVLEPQFAQILSFLSELNNNPDQIVTALGLNFNPEKELDSLATEDFTDETHFSGASSEEIHDEFQAVSLVTDSTEVALEMPDSETSPIELIYSGIPVPSVTLNNGVVGDRQPVSSVAMATQVNPSASLSINGKSSANTLLIDKPATEIIPQHQDRRSLAIATEVPNQDTTLLASAMPTQIPRNDRNLKSLAVAIKVPSNNQPLKMQLPDIPHKVKLLPNTNARSLASWVDEFCQGADWDPEDSIFIHF